MRLFILLVTIVISSTSFASNRVCPDVFKGNIRSLSLPSPDSMYSELDSSIISSARKLGDLIATLENEYPSPNKQLAVDTLHRLNIDFSKEALILVRSTQSSGSNRIKDPVFVGIGTSLLITHKVVTPMIGTADMAEHAFAYIVDKTNIINITVQIGNETPIEFIISQN